MQLDASLLKKKNSFFGSFDEGEVKKILQHGVINRYPAGQVVFWQGDEGESMFIVLTGEVEILLKGQEDIEEVLAILGPGEVFGEGSFARKSPRTAKAMSTKDTYLYVINSNHLEDLVNKESKVAAKLVLELLQIVCKRLQITNLRLSK